MKLINLLLICVMVSCGKNSVPMGMPVQSKPSVLKQKMTAGEFRELKIKAIKNFAIGFGSDVFLSNSMDTIGAQNLLRRAVLRSIKTKLEHGYGDQEFNEKESLILLSNWSDRQFFMVENRLKKEEIIEETGFINMELELPDKLEIRDLKLSFYSFSPMDFSLNKIAETTFNDILDSQNIHLEVPREQLVKAILEKHQFFLRVNNYSLPIVGGVVATLKKYMQARKEKFARVIVSTADKTEVLYIESGKRLEELLPLSSFPAATESIVSWKEKPWSKSDKGKWFFFGSYNTSSKTEVGKTYVIAHTKWWELYNASKTVVIKSVNVSYENIISDVGPGTVLNFTIWGKRPKPNYQNVEQLVEYGVQKAGQINWGNWCTIVRREYLGVLSKKIVFLPELMLLPVSLKIGEKTYHISKLMDKGAKLTLLEDDTKVKFKLHLSGDLISNTQSIRLKMKQSPDTTSGSVGMVDYGTCQKSPKYIFREPLLPLHSHEMAMPLFDSYAVELRVERELLF